MRRFSNSEKAIIRKLVTIPGLEAVNFSEWLGKNYFTEAKGRALLFQLDGQYGVLYLRPEVFKDEKKKRIEIVRLLEFASFINHLVKKRYVHILGIEPRKAQRILCMHDSFTNIRRAGNQLLLNDKGDFSNGPLAIMDKEREVIYQGVIFTNTTYQFLLTNTTGSIYISNELRLLCAANFQEKVKKKKPRPHPWLARAAMLLGSASLVAALVFLMLHFIGPYVLGSSQQSTLSGQSLQPHTVTLQKRAKAPLKLLYGIDISRYNGNLAAEIDAADSLSFTICKATEGMNKVDPDFAQNWQWMNGKKMITGVYHFYREGEPPAHQAKFFWRTVVEQGRPDITPVVDIEQASLPFGRIVSPENVQRNLLLMLYHLEAESGRVPMIYTDWAFAEQFLNNSEFKKYPLWLAEYSDLHQPLIPRAWRSVGFRIWQKSDRYNIDSHIADFDVFYGDREDLMK